MQYEYVSNAFRAWLKSNSTDLLVFVILVYLLWSIIGHEKSELIRIKFQRHWNWLKEQQFSIRHDYKTNFWILEKPGNSWKILENKWTSENGFITDLLFINDFILNSRILPSRAPTNHPTIFLDIICIANINGFFFISWVLLKQIMSK